MNDIVLSRGSHKAPEDGLCFMEAITFLAKEVHSDTPKCVALVYSAFGRELNDAPWSTNDARTKALMPLVPFLIGTKGKTNERNVSERLLKWGLRILIPYALRSQKFEDEAARLDKISLKASISDMEEEVTKTILVTGINSYSAQAAGNMSMAVGVSLWLTDPVTCVTHVGRAVANVACMTTDDTLILAVQELSNILNPPPIVRN